MNLIKDFIERVKKLSFLKWALFLFEFICYSKFNIGQFTRDITLVVISWVSTEFLLVLLNRFIFYV